MPFKNSNSSHKVFIIICSLALLLTGIGELSYLKVFKNTDSTSTFGINVNQTMEAINRHNSSEIAFKKIAFIDNIGENLRRYRQSLNISSIYNFISETTRKFALNQKIDNFIENYEANIDQSKGSFAITPMHSIYKPESDGWNLPQPSNILSLDVAKGEFESFQILILPYNGELNDISISLSGLPFSANNIKCYQSGYVDCRPPVYKAPRDGWFADPLISLESEATNALNFKSTNYSFKIKDREVSSIWVSVHIPDSIKAGIYNITAKVQGKSNNKISTRTTNIKLHIYNVNYPKNNKLKTAIGFNHELYMYYNGYSDFEFNKRKIVYDFLSDQHLTPCEFYRAPTTKLFPPIDDWKYLIDRGCKSFQLGYFTPNTAKYKSQHRLFDSAFRSDIRILNKTPFKKYAFLFGYDEMNSDYWENIKEMKAYVNNIDKSIPIGSTIEPTEKIKPYLDIWMPITSGYNPEKFAKCVKPGAEVWWSQTMSSLPPYPTLFIDAYAIEPRIMFWQGSKYNIDGFKYYESILWYGNFVDSDNHPLRSANYTILHDDKNALKALHEGKRWPEVKWNSYSWSRYNGDGQLFYPGKNGELLPSIRSINMRDGIEDFEIFYLLKQQLKQAVKSGNAIQIKQINKFFERAYSITPNNKDYLNQPELLLNYRKEALELLEVFQEVRSKG